MGARVSADSFLQLPRRWLDVYSMLNAPLALNTAHHTIEPVVGALSLLGRLSIGIKPNEAPGALAFELLNGNKSGQERAWQRLARCLPRPIGLEAFQALSREERGLYLQDALRMLNSAGSSAEHYDVAAACAFMATRLAPGSLEHLEVLKSAARPEMLTWYALYAALQHPKEILSWQNCLGFRVMRDLLRVEDKLAPPIADVSYAELKIVARSELDSIAGRIGHVSELLVELIPYVSASFTFQRRNRFRQNDETHSLDLEPSEVFISPRERVARAAADLAQLARDLPDYQGEYPSRKKPRRNIKGA